MKVKFDIERVMEMEINGGELNDLGVREDVQELLTDLHKMDFTSEELAIEILLSCLEDIVDEADYRLDMQEDERILDMQEDARIWGNLFL
jgi:hypothetical protein